METRRPAPSLSRAELSSGIPIPTLQGLFTERTAAVRTGKTEGMGKGTREVSVGADGVPVVQCRGGAEEGACGRRRWLQMVAGA